MERKELLELLRQGRYITGEEIGRRLYVTRAAVSKAVARLRREGCVIRSAPNRGYLLVSEPDRLSAEAIRSELGDHPWAELVQVLPLVDSTNNCLKTLAARGAPEGTALLAERQSAGRGRLGRSFDSPEGGGIYLSVLLRPGCPPAELMTLTAQAAVAVSRAVARVCGVTPEIKWVNDLLLGGKKICGILTELTFEAESALVDAAVVGVGINCNRQAEDFPPQLQSIAGSILSQTGTPVDRNRLAAQMLLELSRLPALDWQEDYRRLCVNLGRRVRIISPGAAECPEGIAEDVGPEAQLLVRLKDGSLYSVAAGEVSLRSPEEQGG